MSINNKILIILYKEGAGKNFLTGVGAPASPPASATVCYYFNITRSNLQPLYNAISSTNLTN
jgi:hypothetical protein